MAAHTVFVAALLTKTLAPAEFTCENHNHVMWQGEAGCASAAGNAGRYLGGGTLTCVKKNRTFARIATEEKIQRVAMAFHAHGLPLPCCAQHKEFTQSYTWQAAPLAIVCTRNHKHEPRDTQKTPCTQCRCCQWITNLLNSWETTTNPTTKTTQTPTPTPTPTQKKIYTTTNPTTKTKQTPTPTQKKIYTTTNPTTETTQTPTPTPATITKQTTTTLVVKKQKQNKLAHQTTTAVETQTKSTHVAYAYATVGLCIVFVGCCVAVVWGVKRKFTEHQPDIVVMPQPTVSNYLEPVPQYQQTGVYDNAHDNGIDNAMYAGSEGTYNGVVI